MFLLNDTFTSLLASLSLALLILFDPLLVCDKPVQHKKSFRTWAIFVCAESSGARCSGAACYMWQIVEGFEHASVAKSWWWVLGGVWSQRWGHIT